jgi:hypothetical protein
MEIGGRDLTIQTSVPKEARRELLLAYLQSLWPNGVIEEDDLYPGDFFYYENLEAKISWDEEGATDEDRSQMAYCLFGDENSLTVVHDGLDEDSIRKIFH